MSVNRMLGVPNTLSSTGGAEEEHHLFPSDLDRKLTAIRTWYNHERPHDHLRGRTPAEVWAGIDIFMAKPG